MNRLMNTLFLNLKYGMNQLQPLVRAALRKGWDSDNHWNPSQQCF